MSTAAVGGHGASEGASRRCPWPRAVCKSFGRRASQRNLGATYSKAPAGYPNPYAGTIKAKVNFDSDLSESRYYVVLSMFDQLVTFRHKELPAATKGPGEEASGPGARSPSRRVPAAVPSLTHGSRPLSPSSAAKYRRPSIAVSDCG